MRQIAEIVANPDTSTCTEAIQRVLGAQTRHIFEYKLLTLRRKQVAIVVAQVVVGRDLGTRLHTLTHAQLAKQRHTAIRVIGIAFYAREILHVAPLTAMREIDSKAVARAVGMRKEQVGGRVERIARTRLDVQHRLATIVPDIGIGSRNRALLEVGCPAHGRDRIFNLGAQRNGILHTRRDGQFIGRIERGSVLLGHHHLLFKLLSLNGRNRNQEH